MVLVYPKISSQKFELMKQLVIGMHLKLTHLYKGIEHIQRFIRSKFIFPEKKKNSAERRAPLERL